MKKHHLVKIAFLFSFLSPSHASSQEEEKKTPPIIKETLEKITATNFAPKKKNQEKKRSLAL